MREPLCIDTDVCIDFLRNREPGCNKFSNALKTHHCFISAITAYELNLGAKLMTRPQDIEGFLVNLTVLPFTPEVAKKAAEIHAELRRIRAEIGLPDIFIAATCLVEKSTLLTRNISHYQRVKGLKLLD